MNNGERGINPVPLTIVNQGLRQTNKVVSSFSHDELTFIAAINAMVRFIVSLQGGHCDLSH